MATYVEFVSRLIYGSDTEAEITPNHSTWISDNPSPTGSQWFAHHVDNMLAAYENWLADNNLPPVTVWEGEFPLPWDPTNNAPIPVELDGSFTGVASEDDLGEALKDRWDDEVSPRASELNGDEKAPFSYRYWGYMKWAQQLRDRFNGGIPIPPATIYDRDGTMLSAIPFTNVFNELHWRWHGSEFATFPTDLPDDVTPGFATSVGQRARAGGVGMGNGEEFILFHRDHIKLFTRWLDRTGQPAVRGRNMHNNNSQGWPGSDNTGNPSTWVEADIDPWINDENGDTDNNLLNDLTDVEDLGAANLGSVHSGGHFRNSDIQSVYHNNYVPRFFTWHGWIDNQLWWREPRFARWDDVTGLRDRVFEPVLNTSADWPGMNAITIVRDLDAPEDAISPVDALSSFDLSTGAGTLRMKLLVQDSYERPVTLRLKAEVFDDATDPTTPVETIAEAVHTYTVGDTGGGDDFDLDSEFTVDFAFTNAFLSDDPTRANTSVGFVNSRIRITGTLEVEDGSDPGFIHEDYCDIHLVQEKQAPEVELYFDLSAYSEDQVNSAMDGGEARFNASLIVVVQDKTSMPASITWPDKVADEVKGLLTGFTPASGLFDDVSKAPNVEILDDTGTSAIVGLTAELASGPLKEDASLPDNQVQRYTYRYDVVFEESNDAFIGLETGDSRFAQLRVSVADRSGNTQTELGQIKLFKEANPFMRDDQPSWLSIDTRVFRLFEGEDKFDATLNAGQANNFIQEVIQNLNTGATTELFDDLPTNQETSALEYSTAITNPSAGTSQNVHNFAIAKVRLQGSNGAADVRAFFRLFRYTASNLIFDETTGYRTHDGGASKLPLLGFSEAAAGDVISIPFFAEPRVAYTDSMTSQTDTPNVQTFVAGPTEERELYFGVYLDINQDDARLPGEYIAAHPDGGFNVAEVQSIRSLMTDAHQCMVVEINYDGDPTLTGDTPANSDNLAQRNLMILYTDNPGAPLTHSVQHSFEVDLGRRLPRKPIDPVTHAGAMTHVPATHVPVANTGIKQLQPMFRSMPALISADKLEKQIVTEALDLAFQKGKTMEEMMDPTLFRDEAERIVKPRYPFVFDSVQWNKTSEAIDELMINWNELPAQSTVEMFLPGINCEQVINLRNLRHAPGDVKILDSNRLQLTPGDITYLPLPPSKNGKVAGVITVQLPDGIKKGQQWWIDVAQLRGAERRIVGGFRMDIQVSEAKRIADAERRLLEVMFERLSLTPKTHYWHPILLHRVNTIRERAKALAESAGIEWNDPTVWIDPEQPDQPKPLEGPKLRVVLEKIQILDDHDPWIKGRGEICFHTRVGTQNNGGILQKHRLPEKGIYKVSDKPGRNIVELNQEIFCGYAKDDLRVEIVATELDTFDPDDTIGKYSRVYCQDASEWYGRYSPDDETPIDPEDLISWRVWYRIEKA